MNIAVRFHRKFNMTYLKMRGFEGKLTSSPSSV